MKKLTALFMGCIMITGAFASCGKDEADSSSSSSSKKDNDPLQGKWTMDVEEMPMNLEFNSGSLSLEMDLSEEAHFSGKNFIVEGSDLGAENTSFENDKLTVNMNSTDLLHMTRIEGEGDALDGTYNELGGMLFDELSKETGDLELKAKIDGEKLIVIYDKLCTYTVSDDTVTLKNPPAALLGESGKDEAEMKFKIEGDKLTLTSDDGTEDTLTRIK